MWGSILVFTTSEYLGDSVTQICQRERVKLDFCALTCAVDGTEPNAGGNAVDDGLCDLHTTFSVLRRDGETEIYDIGLCSLHCHFWWPFIFALVGVLCGAGCLIASLTFFIYYLINNAKNQIKMQTLMISTTYDLHCFFILCP